MVTKSDYSTVRVEAAEKVLKELAPLLDHYHEQITIVGGSAPRLLLPKARERHIGTVDLDLALKGGKIGKLDLKRKLKSHHFSPDPEKPFAMVRRFSVGGKAQVELDFLTGGSPKSPDKIPEYDRLFGVKALVIPGMELAFESPELIKIPDPQNPKKESRIQVVNPAALIVLKGLAMEKRINNKDFYDLYYCLKFFLTGPGREDLLKKFDRLNQKSEKVKKSMNQIKRLLAPQENLWVNLGMGRSPMHRSRTVRNQAALLKPWLR